MVKLYNSGQEFLLENNKILAAHPLETLFFEVNAKFMQETNANDFLVKVTCGNDFLLVVHNKQYPMVIFGAESLCKEFAQFAVANNLTFSKLLGGQRLCEKFFAEYESLAGCTHAVNHAMDLMRCDCITTSDVSGVETPTQGDADELAELIVDFAKEAMGEDVKLQEVRDDVLNKLSSFAIVKMGGKIVSLASTNRETDELTAICNVYTLPQFRGRGFSCKVVTYLTKKIIDNGKLPYLFVDKTNPISNHLYSKIGYTYVTPQYEYVINR